MEIRVLEIIGLSLNIIGALILLIPNFNPWKHLSNEEILDVNLKEEKTIQKKDLTSSLYSVAGFILLLIGFILQLIGIVIAR